MSGLEGGHARVGRSLIERSAYDEALRRDLLADPKGTIERETGAKLPAEVELRVVEETPETVYLVLPPSSSPPQEGDEISDRELEAVAGGGLGTDGGYTCGGASTCYYVGTVCSS